MKHILIIIFFFSIMFPLPASAATPTPVDKETASPTDESKTNLLNKQINDLKTKIASRVASLKLVDKRGVIGTVTDVEDTQITLIDPQQKTRIIDIDEITKFSSSSSKSSFGISDIKKGAVISVLGLYNKQSRRILARFVENTTKPIFLSGVVTDINEDDFTVSIIDVTNTTTVIDIEKITKTNSYSEEDDIVKSGFSKLSPGDRVVVTGYPQEDEENRITGLRILQLPEAPKNPEITFDYPEPTAAKTSATPTP